MDLVTQALLGGTLAQSVMRDRERRLATFTGMAAGMLADADVLIRASSDPLLTLEYHRHFTHALVFIPVGAAIAAGLCWLLTRRRFPFVRVYLYALLGYSLSGLLDASTSYGTRLLWPFSDQRIAWNLLPVVDPVFSLALLLGLVISYRTARPAAARVALLLCACYLGFAAVQQQRATTAQQGLIASRGHVYTEQALVKPTLGNLLLWRTLYLYDGVYHIDAVRVGFSDTRIYTGKRADRYIAGWHMFWLPTDSTQADDIRRFERFSDGYLAMHPGASDVIGDIRYSMLPDGNVPLWGIEVDRENPDSHVGYRVFREQDADDRRRFLDMLFGR